MFRLNLCVLDKIPQKQCLACSVHHDWKLTLMDLSAGDKTFDYLAEVVFTDLLCLMWNGTEFQPSLRITVMSRCYPLLSQWWKIRP